MIARRLQRQKGSRIGFRVRAEAALLEALGVPKAEIARRLRIARESLRLFRHGDEGRLYRDWIEIARRRLAAGVSSERVVDELLETGEVRLEKTDPVAGWEAIEELALFLAAEAHHWNEKHGEDLLVTDRGHILALAAAHVGEPHPAPGCEGRGDMIRAMLTACVQIPCCDRDGLAEEHRRGAFVPWKVKGD